MDNQIQSFDTLRGLGSGWSVRLGSVASLHMNSTGLKMAGKARKKLKIGLKKWQVG